MSEEIEEGYYVRRREFLNEDPDLPAFIIGIVDDTRQIPDDDPNRRWDDGTITLDLADCYRRVSFDFAMYDADERANSLRKITLIAEVVNAVREGIALEVESRNARPAKTEQPSTEAVAETEPVNIKAASATQSFTSHFTTLGL
jgi:hypothetical protein